MGRSFVLILVYVCIAAMTTAEARRHKFSAQISRHSHLSSQAIPRAIHIDRNIHGKAKAAELKHNKNVRDDRALRHPTNFVKVVKTKIAATEEQLAVHKEIRWKAIRNAVHTKLMQVNSAPQDQQLQQRSEGSHEAEVSNNNLAKLIVDTELHKLKAKKPKLETAKRHIAKSKAEKTRKALQTSDTLFN